MLASKSIITLGPPTSISVLPAGRFTFCPQRVSTSFVSNLVGVFEIESGEVREEENRKVDSAGAD
jgi:hypothetical protein